MPVTNSQAAPRLTTRRLLLREYAKQDFDALRAIDSDPEVQKYRGALTITEEQTRQFIEYTQRLAQQQPRTRYPFVVVPNAEQQVIGACGLNITNVEWREAELYYVFNRSYWGQGYATEAATALLGFGFATLQLHRIFAECHPDNIGSWRVMDKIGMTREGRLREHYLEGGQWRDSFVYAILDREWKTALQST